jgi:hypothetical protein
MDATCFSYNVNHALKNTTAAVLPNAKVFWNFRWTNSAKSGGV